MIETMSLNDYLRSKEEMPDDFAKRAGIGIATVRRLMRGQTPTKKTGRAILSATDNQVTPNNFFGLYSLVSSDGVLADA